MGKPVVGEVVVIPFPQTDLKAGKRRPALVLVDLPGADVILCQITSRARSDESSVTPDETRLCADEVQLALTILQPGFRLLVDLTGLQSMDPSCSSLIANIMEMCNAAGIAEVIRIIPDPTRDIGLQILSFFHYGTEVYIRTCGVAEARQMLRTESA